MGEILDRVEAAWEFWIDRGGTFTDIVARRPDGALVVKKLLSESPAYADAATQGVRELLGVERGPIPAGLVDAVKMGTTVATNALLERKGEPTVLAITRGLGDALRIGWQSRPRLFDRKIVLPDLLYGEVVEIDERVTAEGEVLRPLDETKARTDLMAAYDKGYRAIAIVLMHGWRWTGHERRLAEIARKIGFSQVSISNETAALIKLVGRGDTTVADAYLSPGLKRYVDRVADDLGRATRLLFMQSNGGLVDAHAFRGKDAILSGPAGGVVGMAKVAAEAGFERIIGFDMGGTSTDVSHYAGAFERTTETEVAGVRLRAPMMAVHTVAAGGGSICRFDGARLRVGPQSAGADPGPACYGRGGPLTVTDCNVLLGKLSPRFFPKVFGPKGGQPLDAEATRARFAELADEVSAATGKPRAPEELAEGFLTIAVGDMARAIARISIQRGYDPTRYALVCFGGAGGQHACLVADALGMTSILINPFAGVLSAYGMGLADLRVLREAGIEAPLSVDGREKIIIRLSADAEAALRAQGIPFSSVEVLTCAKLRYAGTDTALEVAFGPAEAMRAAFEETHRRRFGFVSPETPLVVESLSAEAVGAPPAGHRAEAARAAPGEARPIETALVRFSGRTVDAPVYDRDALGADADVTGPAIIVEATATTVVEPGWRARVDGRLNLILERIEALPSRKAAGTDVDPVLLEVFNSLFMSIAEEMGLALQATAASVNIKERLDFSCALFDREGALIANAPHIPVHLGSMGESIRAILKHRGDAGDGRGIRRGDVYMLNAPYNGGTHLPDVTVIAPVFLDGPGPAFFVAARGHHADIGGLTPGSMPPMSRRIEEEGVLIDDVLLIDEGRLLDTGVRALLASGPYPARNPDQNMGDFKAQAAACARGAEALKRMVAEFGLDVVEAYMGHVQANAEEQVRRAIGKLKDGEFAYELDSGAVVRVKITVDSASRSARVDFTGTSPQLDGNFNAPLSITRAAVLYVFRTLVDDDIPLNEGCLKPIELIVPEGSMLNPRHPAAVVAGNVETSQVVVDTLYGALGALAASQGTMNNFTFGDDRRQYYETICGGSGAGDGFDGASAVQTHMTNSRLTDPEVLELRFPVLVEDFAIRKGSGGEGKWHGGDGVVRRIRFREPMTAAILSNHRRIAPFGLQGGGSARPGRNTVERTDSSVEVLSGTAAVEMDPGDAFVIETPGGGGFGEPEAD
jgi:5-oxoprolinase (ATP-hydrolysing)